MFGGAGAILSLLNQNRLSEQKHAFLENLQNSTPRIKESISSLLRRIRSRKDDEEIIIVLKSCAEESKLAVAIGEVPSDALLMKLLNSVLDKNAASIVFDMLYGHDPVEITNIVWVSSEWYSMTGKNPDDMTPRDSYEGDPDFCKHSDMTTYVQKFMEVYEDPERQPFDLTSIPAFSFSRKLDYMIDIDSEAVIFLQVGMVVSFPFGRSFFVSTISWRVDFHADIIDFAVQHALNDHRKHQWDVYGDQSDVFE